MSEVCLCRTGPSPGHPGRAGPAICLPCEMGEVEMTALTVYHPWLVRELVPSSSEWESFPGPSPAAVLRKTAPPPAPHRDSTVQLSLDVGFGGEWPQGCECGRAGPALLCWAVVRARERCAPALPPPSPSMADRTAGPRVKRVGGLPLAAGTLRRAGPALSWAAGWSLPW